MFYYLGLGRIQPIDKVARDLQANTMYFLVDEQWYVFDSDPSTNFMTYYELVTNMSHKECDAPETAQVVYDKSTTTFPTKSLTTHLEKISDMLREKGETGESYKMGIYTTIGRLINMVSPWLISASGDMGEELWQGRIQLVMAVEEAMKEAYKQRQKVEEKQVQVPRRGIVIP